MTKKQWIDHNGNEVPAQYVPGLDKTKERTADKTLKKAIKLNKALNEFKKETLKECDSLYNKMLSDHDVKKKGKGNYSITSFDKSIKIEVSMQERIEFDDQIQIAQEKINQYLVVKTGDVDQELQQIINLAFKTSKGRLDAKRVLSLFGLKINHPLWIEAMDILKSSINRNVSKRYLRVWKKDTEGDYKSIELNFSSI